MSTEPELFPAEAVTMDSPRLAWCKRHNAVTFHSLIEPAVWMAGFSQNPVAAGDDAAQWMFEECGAHGSSRVGEGDTEDEALAEAARIHGIRLWNEEESPEPKNTQPHDVERAGNY